MGLIVMTMHGSHGFHANIIDDHNKIIDVRSGTSNRYDYDHKHPVQLTLYHYLNTTLIEVLLRDPSYMPTYMHTAYKQYKFMSIFVLL